MSTFAGALLVIAAACLGVLGDPNVVESILLGLMAVFGAFVMLD